jgi:hypothetical protein
MSFWVVYRRFMLARPHARAFAVFQQASFGAATRCTLAAVARCVPRPLLTGTSPLGRPRALIERRPVWRDREHAFLTPPKRPACRASSSCVRPRLAPACGYRSKASTYDAEPGRKTERGGSTRVSFAVAQGARRLVRNRRLRGPAVLSAPGRARARGTRGEYGGHDDYFSSSARSRQQASRAVMMSRGLSVR